MLPRECAEHLSRQQLVGRGREEAEREQALSAPAPLALHHSGCPRLRAANARDPSDRRALDLGARARERERAVQTTTGRRRRRRRVASARRRRPVPIFVLRVGSALSLSRKPPPFPSRSPCVSNPKLTTTPEPHHDTKQSHHQKLKQNSPRRLAQPPLDVAAHLCARLLPLARASNARGHQRQHAHGEPRARPHGSHPGAHQGIAGLRRRPLLLSDSRAALLDVCLLAVDQRGRFGRDAARG